MVFIESRMFSKLLPGYLNEQEYQLLQEALILRPEMGDLIQGSSGLRKLRWKAKGRGQRGGIRVIYYYLSNHYRFYMLTLYAKGEVNDLTASEKRALTKIMQDWRDEQET